MGCFNQINIITLPCINLSILPNTSIPQYFRGRICVFYLAGQDFTITLHCNRFNDPKVNRMENEFQLDQQYQ